MEYSTDFEIGVDDIFQEKQRTEAGSEIGMAREALGNLPFGSPAAMHVKTAKDLKKHKERVGNILPRIPTLHNNPHHPNATHHEGHHVRKP